MNQYEKAKNGSYFHNNYVEVRPSDRINNVALITSDNEDGVTCRLNGYAIVPIEKYMVLTRNMSFDTFKEMCKINQSNKEMEITA